MSLWFSNPALTTNTVFKRILSDGINNPIDIGPVILSNMRGRVKQSIRINDNGYGFSFTVDGGSYSRNNPIGLQFNLVDVGDGCEVLNIAKNTFNVTTPIADAGGRTYQYVFSNTITHGPTIELVAGAPLATDNITCFSDKQMAY